MRQDYDVFSSSLKATGLQGGTAIRHDEAEKAFFSPVKTEVLALSIICFRLLYPTVFSGRIEGKLTSSTRTFFQ